jgi:hypothetical protein
MHTTIWGDTLLINDIDTLYTQPVFLNNLDQNRTVTAAIVKPDKDVYTFINEVNISVETARLIEQTVILPLSDIAHLSGPQTTIFPAKVKVRFTSIQNSFNPSDTVLFRAVINSDKTNPLTKKSPVFLTSFPANITVMGMEPKEVEFLIIKNK